MANEESSNLSNDEKPLFTRRQALKGIAGFGGFTALTLLGSKIFGIDIAEAAPIVYGDFFQRPPSNLIFPEATVSNVQSALFAKPRSIEITNENVVDLFKNAGVDTKNGIHLLFGALDGNYLTQYSFGRKIDESNFDGIANARNLARLKKLLIERNKETGNHTGVKFQKGDVIAFSDVNGIRDSYTADHEIPIEINKLCYFDGEVYLGVTNAFTVTGHDRGDLFIRMSIDEALEKMIGADKRSTLTEHVSYRGTKNTNILAGWNYFLANSGILNGKIDIVRSIGLVGTTQQLIDRGYVVGQAWDPKKKKPRDEMAGGVCHASTSIFSSIILGADAFGIPYKVLMQDKHSEDSNKYVLITNNERIKKGRHAFDVTAYASFTEVLAGGTIELSGSNGLTWHLHLLHKEPWILRAILETRHVK